MKMTPALKTLAIFGLLVPPLTGVVVAFATGVYWYAIDPGPREGGTPLLQMMVMAAAYAVPVSYLMGGVQAIATGVGSAAWTWWKGILPLYVPLGLAFGAWAGFSIFLSNLWQKTGMDLSEVALSANGAFLLVIHLFAGALGWWVARRFARDT